MNSQKVIAVVVMTLLPLVQVAAARRTISFRNGTGVAVDDLHIIAKVKVSVDFVNTSPFTDERGAASGKEHNLYNGNVAKDAQAKVVLTSSESEILLTNWWWTNGGTASSDGNRVGNEHKDADKGGKDLSFNGPPTGDGRIRVTVGGLDHIFSTTSGFSSTQTLQSFLSFLDGFVAGNDTLIAYAQTSPSSVEFVGNVLGDSTLELTAQIITPDATQEFSLTPIAVPSITQWGALILTALLLMSGVVLMLRRGSVEP